MHSDCNTGISKYISLFILRKMRVCFQNAEVVLIYVLIYMLRCWENITHQMFNFERPKKQPFRAVLWKRCFENMQQIYRGTPIPKCDFNKVSNFIEIVLRHGCSPVNLPHIFRTTFSKNTSGWLLLEIASNMSYIQYLLQIYRIYRIYSNF